MGRLGLVAAGGRGWKALVGPAAFLLAATIAVVGYRAIRHGERAPAKPAPTLVARRPAATTARSYSVKAGDTVASIAAKTGVSAGRLAQLNPGLQPTALFIGEKIRLP
jgi:LysM repeat protein